MTPAIKRAIKQILMTPIVVEDQPLQSTAPLKGKRFNQMQAVPSKSKSSEPSTSQAHGIVGEQVTILP